MVSVLFLLVIISMQFRHFDLNFSLNCSFHVVLAFVIQKKIFVFKLSASIVLGPIAKPSHSEIPLNKYIQVSAVRS